MQPYFGQQHSYSDFRVPVSGMQKPCEFIASVRKTDIQTRYYTVSIRTLLGCFHWPMNAILCHLKEAMMHRRRVISLKGSHMDWDCILWVNIGETDAPKCKLRGFQRYITSDVLKIQSSYLIRQSARAQDHNHRSLLRIK